MTQKIITEYGALDTSSLQNDRLARVVKSGIYSGFLVKPNGGSPTALDITPGSDGTSVLVTNEGVRVEETETVYAAVNIAAADGSLTRYDLVVAEYKFSSNLLNEQVYKVIKGRNQADLNTDAVKPTVESVYQVPLAYVKVRPRSSFSGSAVVQILITDIFHIPPATLSAPDESSDLKPVISPIDNRRIYVYPGVMTNSEGTHFVEFEGGYSSVLTDALLSEGDSKYYLFGLADDGTVALVSDAETKAGLPDLTNDMLPLAIVKATKIGGSIRFTELSDVRVTITRNLNSVDKNINYHALFANSVFKYMRIEAFDDDSGIKLSSAALLGGDKTDLTATISGTDSSLTIDWSGETTVPSDYVVIVTEDLMAGGNLGTIKHFMVTVDSVIDGLQFYYSGSSANGGFNTTLLAPNTTVRAAGQGIRKLFLKFVIPASAFASTQQIKINSFGVLFELSDSSYNTLSLNSLGLLAFSKAVPNLIANGDFYYWSKNKTDGSRLALNSQSEETFPLKAASPVLADGWMVTSFGFTPSGETVSRIIRDSAPYSVTTAVKIVGDTGTGSMVLEYRIPASQELVGKQLTFAIGYESSTASSVSIGIAQFKRGDNGLEVSARSGAVGTSTEGEIVVNSTVIAETTEQVSFYVVLSTPATYTLYNARAAAGYYNKLEYNQVMDARSILRQYYERGRLFNAVRSTTGGLVGASTQFGTPKAEELGTLTIQLADESTSNRSTGVGELTLDATIDGVVVTTTSTSNGDITVDCDWECFVTYEGSAI